MKVKFLKRGNKKFSEFAKREWEAVHPAHYGTNLDWDYWKFEKVKIKAEDEGEIVGILSGHFMGGILYIGELIVAANRIGQGIGTLLLNEAEKLVKEKKGHLMYLETGENWKSVKFYEAKGFKTASIIKNFYERKNFRIMTKEV